MSHSILQPYDKAAPNSLTVSQAIPPTRVVNAIRISFRSTIIMQKQLCMLNDKINVEYKSFLVIVKLIRTPRLSRLYFKPNVLYWKCATVVVHTLNEVNSFTVSFSMKSVSLLCHSIDWNRNGWCLSFERIRRYDSSEIS